MHAGLCESESPLHLMPDPNPNDPPPRCTLRDIAARAGVSVSTVGRALKGDPRISAGRREKIQALAEEMGYRPNPMVSALMASFRQAHPEAPKGASLALVYRNKSLDPNDRPMRRVADAFREAADAHGYGFEEVDLLRDPMEARDLEKMLWQRGVQGILFSRRALEMETIGAFDWERMALVGFGPLTIDRQLSRVLSNYRQHMRLSLEELAAVGVRRPALILMDVEDRLSGSGWVAEYEYHRSFRDPDGKLARPLLLRDQSEEERERARRWIEEVRPDAVITHCPFAAEIFAEVDRGKTGRRVSFLSQAAFSEPGFRVTHIDQRQDAAGRAGVDLLVRMIHSNRRGWNHEAVEVAVDGVLGA